MIARRATGGTIRLVARAATKAAPRAYERIPSMQQLPERSTGLRGALKLILDRLLSVHLTAGRRILHRRPTDQPADRTPRGEAGGGEGLATQIEDSVAELGE